MSKQCPNCGSWSVETTRGSKLPYLLTGLALVGLGVGVFLAILGYHQFVASSGAQMNDGYCGAALIFICVPLLIWFFLMMRKGTGYSFHKCKNCAHQWIA